MTSPFLRNRQRKLAAQAGEAEAQPTGPATPAEDSEAGREYAGLKVLLEANLRELSDVASIDARRPMKVEFARAFTGWIDGVVEADQPVQDDILLTNMVWALDYGDIDRAVILAEFAIKHGMAMPERYNRSVACWLREEVATLAISDPDAVEHAVLVQVDELTAEADMHDQAKAKLNKALGRSWAAKAAAVDASDENTPAGAAASYAEQARDHFKRALQLHAKAGVKKDLEAIERFIRKLAEAKE